MVTLLLVSLTLIAGDAAEKVETSTDELVAQLQSDDETVRNAAVKQLGLSGVKSPKLVELLIDRLTNDESHVVRGQAAVALGRIGPTASAAVEPLMTQLESIPGDLSQEPVRWAMIFGLRGIGPDAKPAVSLLEQQLTNDDFQIRCVTCRALGAIGEASATAAPKLQSMLQKDISSVKFRAAEALGNIGPAIGGDAAAELFATIKAPQQQVREQAVIALGKLGMHSEPYLEKLRELTTDKKSRVRARAIQAVWRLEQKDEAAVKSLLPLLDDLDTSDTATIVLGEMGPAAATAVPTLIKKVEIGDTDTKFVSAQALGKIGDQRALPALRELHKSEIADLQQAASEAIGRIMAEE